MRQLILVVIAVGLLGSVVGCRSTGSGLGNVAGGRPSPQPCHESGSCGPIERTSFGVGPRCDGSSASCRGNGLLTRAYGVGICDCEYDNFCASRTPWVRPASVTPPDTKGKGL